MNHTRQLRLDRRDAGNYDTLSLIDGIMDSVFAVLRFGCLLRRNGTQVCLVPDLELQTCQNSRNYERSRKFE